MSRHPPSASQQTASRKHHAGKSGSKKGGNVDETYLHAMTDAQAALFVSTGGTGGTVGTGCQSPFQDINQKTGADVQFDPNLPPVQNTKNVIIRGSRLEIEAAIRLINQKTGSQGPISLQAETFWLQWVEASFPDLQSRAYFLPPVYFNRVPMTGQSIAGQDILVLQTPAKTSLSKKPAAIPSAATQMSIGQPAVVQDSDCRDDATMQRTLVCLQRMSEEQGEVLMGMNQLQFGQYLGEPCYAAAVSQLPLAANLPSILPRKWARGDFDLLLIHRQYGLLTIEVKCFGDNVKMLSMAKQDVDNVIKKKLGECVSQLDKAEAMLSHLVSDIAPGLRITKTIALPNLSVSQVQQGISGDPQLTQDLCRCLGTKDPADIIGLCLCSDQLSDPKTPCDVSSHVMRELGHWWQRRVAGAGPDSHMTDVLYMTLVARFCGPATTVSVPCTCPPRVSVKTLGQAVWCTGECYTAVITLFPEQLHLLNTAPPRVYITGPPGTGKTVVLLLMGMEWLRCGHHVRIMSTCKESRAACRMMYLLLLQTINKQQTAGVSSGHLHLLLYDLYNLDNGKEEERAVNDLSQAAGGGSLYVIADEAGTVDWGQHFRTFCEKALTQVPLLHLWAASCFQTNAPAGCQVEYFTRPLRSPPAVVREVEQDWTMTRSSYVHPYSERGVSDHTDGPPVKRLYHGGEGHSDSWPEDCAACGREVASFLHSLRVGVQAVTPSSGGTTSTTVVSSSGGTTPPCLQWRDVLVMYYSDGVQDSSRMVQGLRDAGIPAQVAKDDDMEDVIMARSDVVWVVQGDHVRGLERKVVVCLKTGSCIRLPAGFPPDRAEIVMNNRSPNLNILSRCTSQLVIVYPEQQAART